MPERDGEPGARRVSRGGGADHAPADHEEVERGLLERVARGCALLAGGGRHAGHTGFVQARRPLGSTTSMRANGAVEGRSSRAATIQSSGVVSSASAP